MSNRVLVIDENLNPRIARELRNRGRNARAIEDIGLKGANDPTVIAKVFNLFDEVVLVTGDDSLPLDHATALKAASATIATIATWDKTEALVAKWDGRDHRNEDEWDQEIVHRWAHIMELQGVGTFRRYRPTSYGDWTARSRK